MKTTIKTIILAAASLFAAMSCQKEESGMQNLVKEGETIQVNINAGLGDFVAADGTKATATPVVRLTWAQGDKVNAYYGKTKINTQPITVNPSQNGIFAKLEGAITAPSGHAFESNDIITFVYSNGCEVEDNLTFNFTNQNATIPFVAYATVKYGDLTSNFSDKMVEFKFATSVMKIAATNLGGGDISRATIDGINTKVTLTPSASSVTCGIAGNNKATITKTGGFDASADKTRAIFTVGLVPEDANSNRKLTINGNKADLTSTAIATSKSYTTPCAFESSDEYVVMKMKPESGPEYTLRWAKKNLGASGINGYGELYSWGEVATKFDYSQPKYGATDIGEDLTKDNGNDVAYAVKGGKWRMPTSQEFKALYDACVGSEGYDKTTNPTGTPTNKGVYWCTNYKGAAGCLFYDGINELFFPAAGISNGTSRSNDGTYGYYWSSTWSSADGAYDLGFDSSGVNPQSSSIRYYGRSVRPVSD